MNLQSKAVAETDISKLPDFESNILSGIMDKIEMEKSFIIERLIEIYREVSNAKRIILVARQGVPIGAALQAIFDLLGKQAPQFSVITSSTSSGNKENARVPIIIPEESEAIENEVLGVAEQGDKYFIDEIFSERNAEARLLKLAEEMDPNSSYKFITMYLENDSKQRRAPWDNSFESGGRVQPDNPNFFSVSEYLSLSQAKNLNSLNSDANVILPVKNPNQNSQIMSNAIANKMYNLGKEAALIISNS